MPRLRRKRTDVQYCLDANISIEAALNVDDVVHLSQLPELQGRRRGRSHAPDVEVAQWCRHNSRVLVTQDSDFTSRKQRAQAIHLTGVEVIFITYELIGVDAHIETIRTRALLWSDHLAKHEYDLRVWYQHPKGQLRQQESPQHPR